MAYFNAKSGEVFLQGKTDTQPQDNIFSHLPLNVVLKIFTFLDAVSLSRCAEVQRSWYQLSNREDIWKEILERDKRIWRCVGFKTHPKIATNGESSHKSIYIHSRPEVSLRKVSQGGIGSFLKKATQKLRSFIPKCILFGSGLESSQLVRNWLLSSDPNSPFKQVGYSQGVNGVGAGIHLELIGQGVLNLVTLYNATWAERKAIVAGERPRINRLLEDPNKATVDCVEAGDEMSYEESVRLLPQIKDLCLTIDLAMFAVDCNAPLEQFRVDKTELKAMLNCSPAKTPLVVLSVQSNATLPVSQSALEVSELLELSELDRPWLAHSVCGTDQSDLVPCVKWCMQELDMIQ